MPYGKRQDETNDALIEIDKGKENKKKKEKKTGTQERRQHARGIRILEGSQAARRGGGALRQKRIITESATKEIRKAKRKAKKAIQETSVKRQNEKEGQNGE